MSNADQSPEKSPSFGQKMGRFFSRKEGRTEDDKQNDSPQENPREAVSVNQSLSKSRTSLTSKLSNLFKGSFDLNDDLFEKLEDTLITSDIGIDASLKLVSKLKERVKKEKLQTADDVVNGLRAEIAELLQVAEQSWQLDSTQLNSTETERSEELPKPYIILMVGVNGVGKTTTSAKIAHHLKQQGKSVMFAAADTFRAAAVEQLKEWGERLDIPVIAQQHGSDAAAVAHDALSAAVARNIDVLMIDTAGRLHTQDDLMQQLEKINRVLQKVEPAAPHEVMQILDAGNGQNAVLQLEHFQKAVGVNSYCLTKLDGSAKGGVSIALTEKFSLPIRFLGTGEGFNDLQAFNARDFADSLIPLSSGSNPTAQ